jgi:DNA-binding PadR family transcriptional regulator
MALVLLALLNRKRMHGYELLAELERVLPGYRASPGSVYPALRALVDEGLVDGVADRRDERRRSFDITATGRSALRQRNAALVSFEMRTGARLSTTDAIETAFDRLRVRVMDIAERLDADMVVAELEKTAAAFEQAAGLGGNANHG